MSFKQSLPVVCAALGFVAITTPKHHPAREQEKTSAQAVASVLDNDWMSRPENDNLFRLYQLLDRGENTTEYFQKSCADYESQGKDHELSGRLADVMARVLTLHDLIKSRKITSADLKIILEKNIVISGIHEANHQPLIIAKIGGDINDFFDTLEPTSTIGVISGSEGSLTFSNGDKKLTLSITYRQADGQVD